jgi:hypothetical protein
MRGRARRPALIVARAQLASLRTVMAMVAAAGAGDPAVGDELARLRGRLDRLHRDPLPAAEQAAVLAGVLAGVDDLLGRMERSAGVPRARTAVGVT